MFTGQDMMEEWSVNSSLTIEDITVDDGGSYVCTVSNEAGVTEARAVLSVSLYISGEPVGLNTTSGSVENITCIIEGFPVSYHWEKYDDMMINYTVVSIGQILQFDPVEFGDEGVYRCVGHSGVGDVLTSTDITVASEALHSCQCSILITYQMYMRVHIHYGCMYEGVPLSVLANKYYIQWNHLT